MTRLPGIRHSSGTKFPLTPVVVAATVIVGIPAVLTAAGVAGVIDPDKLGPLSAVVALVNDDHSPEPDAAADAAVNSDGSLADRPRPTPSGSASPKTLADNFAGDSFVPDAAGTAGGPGAPENGTDGGPQTFDRTTVAMPNASGTKQRATRHSTVTQPAKGQSRHPGAPAPSKSPPAPRTGPIASVRPSVQPSPVPSPSGSGPGGSTDPSPSASGTSEVAQKVVGWVPKVGDRDKPAPNPSPTGSPSPTDGPAVDPTPSPSGPEPTPSPTPTEPAQPDPEPSPDEPTPKPTPSRDPDPTPSATQPKPTQPEPAPEPTQPNPAPTTPAAPTPTPSGDRPWWW